MPSKKMLLKPRKAFSKLKSRRARLLRLKKVRRIVRRLKKTGAFAGREMKHLRRQVVFEHYSPGVKRFLSSLPIAEQRASENALFEFKAKSRLEALQYLKSKRAIPVIEEKLKDADPSIRILALHLLPSLKSKNSVKLIERRMLYDKSFPVRAAAINSLISLKSKKSIPVLRRLVVSKGTTEKDIGGVLLVEDDERTAISNLAKSAIVRITQAK